MNNDLQNRLARYYVRDDGARQTRPVTSAAKAERDALAITRSAAFREKGFAGLSKSTLATLEELLALAAQLRTDAARR